MPCVEGDRLMDRFIDAAYAEHALMSLTPPDELEEMIERMQEVRSAEHFQKSCKSELMEHSRWCPECRLGAVPRSTMLWL